MYNINLKTLGLAVAALALGSAALADSDPSFSYSNLGQNNIIFSNSSTFSFTPITVSNPYNIEVTIGSQTLDGIISGNFTIGAVTVSGLLQSANVSGTGALDIYDGSSWLTSSLTWGNVTQLFGSVGLNLTENANLSGISYSGSNATLDALAASVSKDTTLSATFSPAVALKSLVKTGGSTSFSGTVYYTEVPDSGATALLIGLGGCGILVGVLAQRRKNSMV